MAWVYITVSTILVLTVVIFHFMFRSLFTSIEDEDESNYQ